MQYVTSPVRGLESGLRFPTISVFFEAHPKFVQWMSEFCAGKTIVDCGCGLGNTTVALRMAGMSVVPVDLFNDSSPFIDDICVMNAAFFPFGENNVALICRPCRGEWIHATIIRALESGADVVYVGKESHFEEDLAPLPYTVEKQMTDVGLSHESMWLIKKKSDD